MNIEMTKHLHVKDDVGRDFHRVSISWAQAP